jgi:hypothetical protein
MVILFTVFLLLSVLADDWFLSTPLEGDADLNSR